MNYRLIISLVLIGLIVVFIIQNAAVVEIKAFFWTIAMSRGLLIVILLSIGVLVGWFLKTYFTHRRDAEDEE
jgi:uncharacterized integral membrane protein